MKIISYASGGLGNRILPLASCHDMAKKTGRSLAINWEPSKWCDIRFENLFSNSIEQIDIKKLDPSSTVLYADYQNVVNEYTTYTGRKELFDLASIVGCKPLNTIENIKHEKADNIVVYWCDLLPPFVEIHDFFKELTLVKSIEDILNEFIENNSLDKTVYGIHARGTDFSTSLEQYDIFIEKAMNENKNSRFFLCSDEKEWEFELKKKYGDKLIIRNNKHFVQKQTHSNNWINNVIRDKNSVIDSVIDMMLLSKTTLLISHQQSSFAKCAKYFGT